MKNSQELIDYFYKNLFSWWGISFSPERNLNENLNLNRNKHKPSAN